MGISSARDLLYHIPRRYDDASTVQPIGGLEVGMDATALGQVRSKGVIPTRAGLRIFQAVLEDDSGKITEAWHGRHRIVPGVRRGHVPGPNGQARVQELSRRMGATFRRENGVLRLRHRYVRCGRR